MSLNTKTMIDKEEVLNLFKNLPGMAAHFRVEYLESEIRRMEGVEIPEKDLDERGDER